MPGDRSTARNLVSVGNVGTQAFLEPDGANSRGKSRQDASVDDRRMTLRGVLHGDDNAFHATHEVHHPAHFRYIARSSTTSRRSALKESVLQIEGSELPSIQKGDLTSISAYETDDAEFMQSR